MSEPLSNCCGYRENHYGLCSKCNEHCEFEAEEESPEARFERLQLMAMEDAFPQLDQSEQ